MNDIVADREGYILAYLSNENATTINVHFDDFTVYHGKTNGVSTQDYYPFGLTFNFYERTASTAQNFKFNQGYGEKTFQGEPGVTFRTERVPKLGWDMTKFRMYDYAIGRFINVDPLADIDINYKYSPYSYLFNNPIRWNDPLGDCPCVPSSITNIGNGIARAFETRVNKINNAVSEAADAVGNFVSETVETIEDYIPQVFVSGDNPDVEFFKPNPDGKFNIVIEEEDMNDIKECFFCC